MTAREIVSVLGKLTPDTQQALSERAATRDPRFLFICDLVDEAQSRMCPSQEAITWQGQPQPIRPLARL